MGTPAEIKLQLSKNPHSLRLWDIGAQTALKFDAVMRSSMKEYLVNGVL